MDTRMAMLTELQQKINSIQKIVVERDKYIQGTINAHANLLNHIQQIMMDVSIRMGTMEAVLMNPDEPSCIEARKKLGLASNLSLDDLKRIAEEVTLPELEKEAEALKKQYEEDVEKIKAEAEKEAEKLESESNLITLSDYSKDDEENDDNNEEVDTSSS